MSTSKMIPLSDRVAILPSEAETKSAGGIVIPDTADKDKPIQGMVEYVGTGRYVDGKLLPLQVKKGYKVLFGKYSGTTVKFDGKDFLVMREEDILAVLEE